MRGVLSASVLAMGLTLGFAVGGATGQWTGTAQYHDDGGAVTRGNGDVAAEELPLDIEAEAMDFAMHDASFTIYHEIGHLLIGELDLPVLGRQEDAADALGTIWLLEFDEAEDSYQALVSAADGWYFNALKNTSGAFADLAYSADHTLDLHRAYAMVCFMVGKDAEVFGETADDYGIDADRQEACQFSYEDAFNGWMRVLEPFTRDDDDEGVSDYEVIYEEAGDYAAFAEELKKREIIDIAAATVAQSFDLPRPVTFRVTQCGEENAYYNPEEGEVIYCYELAAALHALYVYDIVGWGDTAN